MRYGILGLSLIFNLLLSTNILAVDLDSHQKAAEELLQATNFDNIMSNMYKQIAAAEVKKLIQKDPCLEPNKEMLNDWMMKYMPKLINPSSFKAQAAKIYMDEFTEKELKELAVFYKTPLGKKSLDRAPIIVAKTIEIANSEIIKSQKSGILEEATKELKTMLANRNPDSMTPECRKRFEEEKEKDKEKEKQVKSDSKSDSSEKDRGEKPAKGSEQQPDKSAKSNKQ